MSAHQLAQGADELIVGDAVHVDLLLLVLQALQASQVRVWHRLDQPVARERLLVGVRGAQALVAVRHLARDARLDGVLRRLLLAELALDGLGRRSGAGHGGGGHQGESIVLAGGVWPAVGQWAARGGGPLDAVDDVLEGDVAFQSF